MNTLENLNIQAGEEMNFLLQPAQTSQVQEINVQNSPQEHARRLNTCMNCEFVTLDRQCTQCKCPVVMMAQFNFKQCPKGYW